MDLSPFLGGMVGLFFFGLVLWAAVWIPIVVVRKAGFPGWYAVALILSFGVGWIILAMAEWPVHRELAWLRMSGGVGADDQIDLVERYAIELERRGDWKAAIEVYEELARRSQAPEGADYYRGCATVLRDRREASRYS